MRLPEVLPNTVDVALDWDYGWPIRSVWHEIDKIFLRWFLRPDHPRARRYIFFEYDIEARVAAETFYADAWNADAAAVDVKFPDTAPDWPWWRHARDFGPLLPHRCGTTPFAATLWSHDALSKIAASRSIQHCFCELRMGTLARALGFRIASLPQAKLTISWQAAAIQYSGASTW